MTICDFCKNETDKINRVEDTFKDIFYEVTKVKNAEICKLCLKKGDEFLREAQDKAIEVKFGHFKEKLKEYKLTLPTK